MGAGRATFPRLPAPVARYFDVAPDARVLAHCHWHERPQDHPTLILLHGLEGSSLAHYMGGMADKAWAADWNVVRLNQRNCGETEHLSRGLYHSGLTHDPLFVLRELIARDGIRAHRRRRLLARRQPGAQAGRRPRRRGPAGAEGGVRRVADDGSGGVRGGAGAHGRTWRISGTSCARLKARMRRKAAVVPGVFTLEPLRRIWTVRQFDEAYTAPHHGFRDADRLLPPRERDASHRSHPRCRP